MNKRLDGILSTITQQYAYHLLQSAPTDDSRLGYLADGLANNGFLVMVADVPVNNFDFLCRTWIDSYNRLYGVISSNLFPLFTAVNLGTADAMRPPVIVMQGEAPAVIQVLAGYIVPYVAMRQKTNTISDAEIRGLMTYILDDLEADELDRGQYDAISRECTQIIRQLITLPIQQYSLTTMKKPLFQQVHIQPQHAPQKKSRPVPPNSLPETGQLNPNKVNGRHADNTPAKKNQDKTQPMPIWFDLDDDLEQTNRFPPVPGLKSSED